MLLGPCKDELLKADDRCRVRLGSFLEQSVQFVEAPDFAALSDDESVAVHSDGVVAAGEGPAWIVVLAGPVSRCAFAAARHEQDDDGDADTGEGEQDPASSVRLDGWGTSAAISTAPATAAV